MTKLQLYSMNVVCQNVSRFFPAVANPPMVLVLTGQLMDGLEQWGQTPTSAPQLGFPLYVWSIVLHPHTLFLPPIVSGSNFTRPGWFPALWQIFSPLWLTSCPATRGDVPLYVINLTTSASILTWSPRPSPLPSISDQPSWQGAELLLKQPLGSNYDSII